MLQEVPSELEHQIGTARRAVTASYLEAESRVRGVVSRWVGIEQSVERVSRSSDAIINAH